MSNSKSIFTRVSKLHPPDTSNQISWCYNTIGPKTQNKIRTWYTRVMFKTEYHKITDNNNIRAMPTKKIRPDFVYQAKFQIYLNYYFRNKNDALLFTLKFPYEN